MKIVCMLKTTLYLIPLESPSDLLLVYIHIYIYTFILCIYVPYKWHTVSGSKLHLNGQVVIFITMTHAHATWRYSLYTNIHEEIRLKMVLINSDFEMVYLNRESNLHRHKKGCSPYLSAIWVSSVIVPVVDTRSKSNERVFSSPHVYEQSPLSLFLFF